MSTKAKSAAAVEPVRVQARPARVPMLLRKCDCGSGGGAAGGESCSRCKADEDRKPLQRKASGSAAMPSALPPIVHTVLRGSGSPLDGSTRAFMESRFGHDFSDVRVHTGGEAAESARAVGAHAYTVGRDIVFDRGRYDPGSKGGRHLLAHELTHTIQQQGVQRSAYESLARESAPGDSYEREADAVAARVLTSPSTPAVLPRAVAHAPLVARTNGAAPPNTAQQPAAPAEDRRTWQDLPPIAVGTGQQANAKAVLDPNTVAFRINQFNLPNEKGPVKSMFERRAAANALEATITFEGSTSARSGLWQQREVTAGLRENWLLKVGWTRAQARANWQSAGGIPDRFPDVNPRARSGGCDMDHILELQLGGTNVPSNLQALDATDNRSAGRMIWEQVSAIARQLRDQLPDPKPSDIVLRFSTINGGLPDRPAPTTATPGGAATCTDVELYAVSQSLAAGPAAAGAGRERQTMSAGTATAAIEVLPPPSSTPLVGDTPTNVAATELVPGVQLQAVNRAGAANGIDTVTGILDPRGRTRVPIAIRGTTGLNFDLLPPEADQRRLRLRAPAAPLAFTYPYLSPGSLKITQDPQRGIVGTGTLKPSLPLLDKVVINVTYANGELAGTVKPNKDQIKLPFPQTRITRAELGVELSPEFRPYGIVAFEIGPEGSPVVDGSFKAETDASGLVLLGDVFARIPKVDNAQGHVEYRNKQWSGFLEIESTKIHFPSVESGRVRANFNDQGYDLSGNLVLAIPGGKKADLSVVRAKSGAWIYTGHALFDVPGLHPVDLTITYDGENITAMGDTGIDFHGFTGMLAVTYKHGRFSGKGTVKVDRPPRYSGVLNVKYSEAGRFSGDGTLTYQLTPSLVATAGVELGEDDSVRVRGALEVAKPVTLFAGFSSERELFNRSLDIPILGISVGPVSIGLIGRITGAFGATYGIGPGELRNIKVVAAFNPLAKQVDPDIQATARLVIPAHAGIYLSVRGAIGISAGVGSVTGGVTARGDLGLKGGLEAGVDIHYKSSRFSVEAAATLSATPVISIKFDADVTAEALGYKKQKVWHLGGFEWGSGQRFALTATIEYFSDRPFKPPSSDQIKFEAPQIDVGSLVRQLVDRATA